MPNAQKPITLTKQNGLVDRKNNQIIHHVSG